MRGRPKPPSAESAHQAHPRHDISLGQQLVDKLSTYGYASKIMSTYAAKRLGNAWQLKHLQPPKPSEMVFDFKNPKALTSWKVLSDADIGGLSHATFKSDEAGFAVFSGALRLEIGSQPYAVAARRPIIQNKRVLNWLGLDEHGNDIEPKKQQQQQEQQYTQEELQQQQQQDNEERTNSTTDNNNEKTIEEQAIDVAGDAAMAFERMKTRPRGLPNTTTTTTTSTTTTTATTETAAQAQEQISAQVPDVSVEGPILTAEQQQQQQQQQQQGREAEVQMPATEMTEEQRRKFYSIPHQKRVVKSGYAAVRSEDNVYAFPENFDAVELKVKTDGRIYVCNIKTKDSVLRDDLYQCMFTTAPDQWERVVLPFNDFMLTWRGRIEDPMGTFLAHDIISFGILMAQRKEGPFRVEIESLRLIDRALEFPGKVKRFDL